MQCAYALANLFKYSLASGTFAGMLAQTFIYPLVRFWIVNIVGSKSASFDTQTNQDVMRRRMQTGKANYPSIFAGLRQIAQQEGIRHGLFRGLTLNYAKVVCDRGKKYIPFVTPHCATQTLPNVAIMMTVYDLTKKHLLAQ